MKAIIVHRDAVDWWLVVEQASWVTAEHMTLVMATNLTYWRSLPRSLSLVNLIVTLLATSHSCNEIQ